jgi:prolyl oligopeptidase
MRTMLATVALFCVAAAPNPETSMKYPETKRDDIVDKIHGVEVHDPYRWLEDASKPEVKAWMAAEDKLARDYLHALPGRDKLKARFAELLRIDAISAPHHFGGRYFYSRRHKDREKSIVYWKEGETSAERVLLDPNALSKDGSVALGSWLPSWDGKRVVYGLHANNSDEETLHVIDVDSGKVSDVDVIPGVNAAGPNWNATSDGFYYDWSASTVAPAERPGTREIRFHKLGTDARHDAVLRGPTGNPELWQSNAASRDGHWLFCYVSSGVANNDLYVRDLRRADGEWQPLVTGHKAQYAVDDFHDHFYVRTNEGAPRFRVFSVDARRLARSAWKEIVAEDKEAVIEGAAIVGKKLVLSIVKDVTSRLAVHELDGKKLRDVPLPGIGSASGLVGQNDEDDAYFAFTSYTTPTEIYRTSVAKGGATLWAKIDVPIDPKPFTVEQVWATSKDGTKVPMFVVRRKDMAFDGRTPLLIMAYGGFNVSLTPVFMGTVFPWLEAGGALAVANLRGGGELGEAWHEGGMLDKKQNVFDDLYASAEWLIAHKYTSRDKLAAMGGSNGGLLMGAATTQRPDLWRAIVCQVPLLDMIRYHLFGAGKLWVSEFGNPDKLPDFNWLYAYSPYHHVKTGEKYPAFLMASADADDRVDPLHARKLIAALQWAQGGAAKDGRPALLRIEKNAGHGGGDMVSKTIESSADIYSFLFQALDVGGAAK